MAIASIIETGTSITASDRSWKHHDKCPKGLTYYHAVNFGLEDTNLDNLIARTLKVYHKGQPYQIESPMPDSASYYSD